MRCLYSFQKYEKEEQKKITVKKNNYDINNEKAQEIYSFLVLYFNIIITSTKSCIYPSNNIYFYFLFY
ncbi:hypothetical protein CF067_17080 [Clostridium sporogenes]